MKTTLKATAIAALAASVSAGEPVQADEDRIKRECTQVVDMAKNIIYNRTQFNERRSVSYDKVEQRANQLGWSDGAVEGTRVLVDNIYDKDPYSLMGNADLIGGLMYTGCKKKGGAVDYFRYLESQ